jgi:pantothenate kinase
LGDNKQQVLSLTPAEALSFLVRKAQALPTDRRVAIGLAGGPGTGKSTLAVQLVEALNAVAPVAAYVPMDGFHMLHAKLEKLGTVADKGAPHTFEGEAFASFISTLKAASGPVSGPGYSREIEDVVQNAFIIAADARILVVEGNYLLLPDPPWHGVRPLLDLSIFIDVPREKVRARLLKRHAEHGLFSEERNRQHIERVDLANYDLVARSRPRADIAIDLLTDA